MFVLSLSGARGHGRAAADPIPQLLEALAPLDLTLPAERTAGPEALAATTRAEDALEVILRSLETGSLAIGLGVGPVDAPLPDSVRILAGGAVAAAADAARAARTTSQVPLAVHAADERQATTAAEVQAVLRLIGWMIRTRNRGQWQAVRALRETPEATQSQLAERLGVTQQTISRAVKTSGWREESAAHPLAVHLLSMIDLTSAR
ncbi:MULTISPECIES: helix-turn-helix domain-containing protein [unclassified Brachybacterium]|uniref:MarR family transcriptional regulator n=1 Tax=unclassified Brachybacterium TaxID=2623841 RepID=UPI000C8081F0|nr:MULTISPECIES: helix-turn-helix domain-containing protein [unclassified Brachybacterium]PMC75808.1 MarR family transcriptional regulator [Brachybacterium sp. UMB0905]